MKKIKRNLEQVVLTPGDDLKGLSIKGIVSKAPRNSRILHNFGPRLSLAALPEKVESFKLIKPVTGLKEDVLELSSEERLALNAIQLRQSNKFEKSKQERPLEDEPWDLHIEGEDFDLAEGDMFAGGIPGPAGGTTSARMVGSVAIGFVFVEGPTADTAISPSDKTKVLAEVIDGLSWLGTQEPDANLSWHYNIKSVKLNIHPGKGGNWPGLPVAFQRNLDASVWRKDNNKIYFFKGNQYIRFSNVGNGVDPGYPKPIAGNWPGLPEDFKDGIDAALWRDSNDKLYFFKGEKYVRFTSIDEGVDVGYPKPIAGNWPGLPTTFNNGIDAAMWSESNGKIYFFKGDLYVRYSNVTSGIDPGYPKPIKGAWGDLDEDFAEGIDAALMRRSNGKIYFFKKGKYLRYTNISSGVDSGYPKAIANEKEDRETLWRDPAMGELNGSPNWNGLEDYVRSLRERYHTQWAYVAFFTRYPLRHFGYANSSRVVMHVDNGSWGMDNIDRVFVHETGHIFGALDEYASSDCHGDQSRGWYRVSNGNCANSSSELYFDSDYPKNIGNEWPGLPSGWDSNLGAVLMRDNGKIYFFKGAQYVRFTNVSDGMDNGYPKKISDSWKNMPSSFNSNIDAALMRDNGKIYFFKDDQYVRFTNVSDGMDNGYPKKISDSWKNMPSNFNSNIDAALMRDNGKIYFFKDGQYVRFTNVHEGMDNGYPQNTYGPWPGLPASFRNNFDAAIERDNRKIYFFKGNEYVRLSQGIPCIMKSNSYEICRYTPGQFGWEAFLTKIDASFWRLSNNKIYLFSGGWYVRISDVDKGPDEGYPKRIGDNWPGLPRHFQQGIDAGLMRESNGKIYFFKGGEYVRFSNVSEGVDAGYPKLIEGNWPGLPVAFNSGIDAALWRESNGKIYFFKGDQYVRFSNVSAGMDSGYPKPIFPHWKGIPTEFRSGIDAALMRKGNGKIYFFKNRSYLRYTNVSNGVDRGYPTSIHGKWMPFPKD